MARTDRKRLQQDPDRPSAVRFPVKEAEDEEMRERLDDEERVYEDLEEGFLAEEEIPPERPENPKAVTPNEFVCRSCFLVLERRHLADPERMLCSECLQDVPHARAG